MYSERMDHIEEMIAKCQTMYRRSGMDISTITLFYQLVEYYYVNFGRDLPWRRTQDPYHIFISEIMLQQTQVDRVIPKYIDWITHFPDFKSVSEAGFDEVMSYWQGLGYNRRALNLHKAATIIDHDYQGILPKDPDILATLPGIGNATAASMSVFAYNTPLVFLETNIRTVFIVLFFSENEIVDDSAIINLLKRSCDEVRPARWYNALMDIGTYFKKTRGNPGRNSKKYRMQEPFHGSKRKIRGQVLSLLIKNGQLCVESLYDQIGDDRIHEVLLDLTHEGLIAEKNGHYGISKKRY